MGEHLVAAMAPKTVSIFGLSVPHSVVVSWVIIAFLGLVFWLCGHRAQMVPGRLQLAGEWFVAFMDDFVTGMVGPIGRALSPYFGAVALYLCLSNLSGLWGVDPPTRDLNVTAALALSALAVMYGTLFAEKGLKGVAHRMLEPSLIMVPFNLIDIVTRPLSLCMRLFGNIFGAYVVMTLVHSLCPLVLPALFGLYFDLFDGLIQMVVFVFLTLMYTQDLLD